MRIIMSTQGALGDTWSTWRLSYHVRKIEALDLYQLGRITGTT